MKFEKKEGKWGRLVVAAKAVAVFGTVVLTISIVLGFEPLVSRIVYGVLGLILIAYSLLSKDFSSKDLMHFVIGTGFLANCVLPVDYFPIYTVSPSSWLIFFAMLFSLVDILVRFISATLENKYLIENLTLEVKAQTVDLEALNLQKNSILQYFTHDLKKLATFTMDNLEKTRKQFGEEGAAIFLDKAIAENKEVISGFNDVGELTSTNEMTEKFKAVELKRLVANVFDFLSPDCEACGVKLFLDCRSKLFVMVRENELTHIIYNLIFNSLEHSKCSEIKLSAFAKGNLCFITVFDNGKGIRGDFNVYSPSHSTKLGNSGIGLTIAKDKIEQMSGEISFDSSHLGTTFSIALKKRNRL